MQQLQETLGAKESECASGLQRIGDLEQQLRLLRRGREEDQEEQCVCVILIGHWRTFLGGLMFECAHPHVPDSCTVFYRTRRPV